MFIWKKRLANREADAGRDEHSECFSFEAPAFLGVLTSPPVPIDTSGSSHTLLLNFSIVSGLQVHKAFFLPTGNFEVCRSKARTNDF